MNDKVKILCCYYKNNDFVPASNIFFPIQCGRAATKMDLGLVGDDTSDNISSRNRYWSEITGLYWVWKNIEDFDYIGLCSYRRFFNFNHGFFTPITTIIPKSRFSEVDNINIPDIPKLLSKYDIILPKKYHYAFSIWNVLRMNYYTEDFLILKQIIKDKYPNYIDAFDNLIRYHNKWYGHNMFIMKKDMFNDYCSWVFNILLEAEKQIDASDYPIDKVRVFGYMHELLLTLYVFKNKLKTFESQLLWVTDEQCDFKFNKIAYKIASNCSFFFNKPRP